MRRIDKVVLLAMGEHGGDETLGRILDGLKLLDVELGLLLHCRLNHLEGHCHHHLGKIHLKAK